MTERRVVRPVGRAMYGRQTPGVRPRAKVHWAGPSLLQRRVGLLVVLLAALGWWLARAFAVQHVVVTGAGESGAAIQSTAQAIIEGSVWSRNLLTLDGEGVSSKLQQADPALRSVDVRRQWSHTVVVAVVLQEPSLGWSTDGQAYVLDRDGTVIGPLPSGSKLPVVMDGSNLPATVGKQVVSTQFVAFVQALAPALAADGYNKVTGLSIKDTTFDLTVTTDKGYALIFDTTRSVGSEVTDLKAVQRVLVAQKQTPASYIDLRIAGKAYYK